MSLADKVLAVNDDLPIRTDAPVHSGKVRSVYWLTAADSARLVLERGYDVAPDAPLAIMVISDRISAFDCIWHAEGGMRGVPGKGAALNAISNHWFRLFREQGLADSHILEIPHPLVWIVQKAKPVMIEAIARQYITGSMWRSYDKGEREFCGITIPDGLQRDQKLPELLITPSSKGVLNDIPGVPAVDDVNVTRSDIENNFSAFKFNSVGDIALYETLLREGRVVENSKEDFRQLLLQHFPDPDILLNKDRMAEREVLARDNALPVEVLMEISKIYVSIAEKITGESLQLAENPKAEIIEVLRNDFALVD